MKFLEKDLEDIIWESDRESLSERGLDINGKMLRQLRIGNYGIADIVTYEKLKYDDENIFSITVYELKKDKISMSAFLQAVGYAKGIQEYIFKRYGRYRELRGFGFQLKIKLIGREIDSDSQFCYLPDIFVGMIEFYKYSYDVSGLFFKDVSGYRIVNNGFNLNSNDPF